MRKGSNTITVVLLVAIIAIIVGVLFMMKNPLQKQEQAPFVSGTVEQPTMGVTPTGGKTLVPGGREKVEADVDTKITDLEKGMGEIDSSLSDTPVDIMSE